MHRRTFVTLSAIALAFAALAAAPAVPGCAAPRPQPAVAPPPAPDVTFTVLTPTGAPAAGAKLSWTHGPSALFGCAGGLPIYEASGTAITDAAGQARLPGGSAYQVLAAGDLGARALDVLRRGELAKTVVLLPGVAVDIELTCGGQPCGQVDARGHISRNGVECKLAFYSPPDKPATLQIANMPPPDKPATLRIANMPQGELELRIQTDRWTPREGLLVHRTPLTADLRAVLDVPIIGGPHAQQGSVHFPDGAPPGGPSHYTTVRAACDNGVERHASPDPANGAFTLTALPDVPCRVSATHSGTRPGRWLAPAVKVIPGAGAAVRLELQPAPSK
jgi:hypothetical protein